MSDISEAKIQSVRDDFPILSRTVYGKPLVYFDNAATTQKPNVVIDAISNYYRNDNANVHRGVHYLSQQATAAFEDVRKKVATFINAGSPNEIVFARGATEAINLVAWSYCESFLNPGDEIIVSVLEHHSNIVPWQVACERKGAILKVIPVTPDGELDLGVLENMLNARTKMVAVSHISNTLGTINPIEEIVAMAHSKNVPVFVDGAQGLSHGPVDVQKLGCDFYAFSSHKMYGPMGIGGLYGKSAWLEKMQPYQLGGEMIEKVTFARTTYNEIPYKFEAGTPNVADVMGLGAAIDYLNGLGWDFISARENDLLIYATARLREVEGIKIIGTAANKAAIISFLIKGIHFFDAGTIMDHMGIAIRTGSHCTQPLMDMLGINGTLRASMAFYNTRQEIDKLIEAIYRVKSIFS
ncbi:MAG: cysteine desulfurase [Anaerolineaceae bacterium]|nr:cysteine desulfurase [Anaerolineaceae bacterium]